MGISTSKDNLEYCNLRSDQFEWETLKDRADMQEKERVEIEANVGVALERVRRDLYVLFPPKLGESSIDMPKEGETDERDEKVIAQFCEFMKRGACKESFMAVVNCVEADEKNSICGPKISKLIKCTDAHSDYYKPIISLAETNVKLMAKDIEALVEARGG